MTLLLRILLITISVLTFAYIIVNIRKSKVKLESLIFWIIFGLMLILLSVFPKIAMFASTLSGFYAPINFILVSIIFLLIYKVFTLTMQLSQVQQKFLCIFLKVLLNLKNFPLISNNSLYMK